MENEILQTTLAENYIESALAASHLALKRTRIGAVVIAVAVAGYLGSVTSTFHENLAPEGAATVVTGLASQRLDDLEPTFASFVHEQVPQAIRRAPDEIIARMPEVRERLEDQVEKDLRAHSAEAGKQLSAHLDRFLEGHKNTIAALLKDGADARTVEAAGDAIEKEFLAFLHEEPVGGETIAEKLDATLSALEQVESRTARLANNHGLSPTEKKARHAVALLMHRIGNTKDTGEVATARATVHGFATSFHP